MFSPFSFMGSAPYPAIDSRFFGLDAYTDSSAGSVRATDTVGGKLLYGDAGVATNYGAKSWKGGPGTILYYNGTINDWFFTEGTGSFEYVMYFYQPTTFTSVTNGQVWSSTTQNLEYGVGYNNTSTGNTPYISSPKSATSATLPALQWHHLVVTADGTNWKFYVDNTLKQTISSADNMATLTESTNNYLTFLVSGYPGRTFAYWNNIAMGACGCYDTALTTDEITTLYNYYKPLYSLS